MGEVHKRGFSVTVTKAVSVTTIPRNYVFMWLTTKIFSEYSTKELHRIVVFEALFDRPVG